MRTSHHNGRSASFIKSGWYLIPIIFLNRSQNILLKNAIFSEIR